jgi:hypothetical protein
MFAVLGREPAELTKSARQRDTGNRFFSIAVDQLLPSADKPQAAYPSMRRGVEEPAKVSFERARVDISNLRELVEMNGFVQVGSQPRKRTGEARWQGGRRFRARSDRLSQGSQAGHGLDASDIGIIHHFCREMNRKSRLA